MEHEITVTFDDVARWTRKRWYAGTHRLHGWLRWLPLYASPMFEDSRHPWRTAVGVMVGVFGRTVYLFRYEAL